MLDANLRSPKKLYTIFLSRLILTHPLQTATSRLFLKRCHLHDFKSNPNGARNSIKTLQCWLNGSGILCVCRQAAMKAVVATSRMHESSRRRTDSCEIPGSGTSRQSSMQQDLPPESTEPAPEDKEDPTQDQQVPQKVESKLADQSAVNPSPPRSPNPPSSEVAPTGPNPVRPPLRGDVLRQASVIPKTMLVQPRLPQKSYSVIEHSPRVDATPPMGSPPSPNNLSNGFTAGVEPTSKTAHCQ